MSSNELEKKIHKPKKGCQQVAGEGEKQLLVSLGDKCIKLLRSSGFAAARNSVSSQEVLEVNCNELSAHSPSCS